MVTDYLYYYAPHLVLIALILIISVWAYSKRAGQKERLKKIALNLGLKYSDRAIEPTESAQAEEPGTVEATGTEGRNRFTEMVQTVSGWGMDGRYEGVHVRIYSTRMHGTERTKSESTCISAFAKWERYCSLMIARESTLSRLGKSLLKMQDIQTTNQELNQQVVIKGLPEHLVKKIVKDSTFQQELLQLFQLDGLIHVDQHGAHYRHGGTLVDETVYRKVLDHVTRTASALERAAKS